MVVAAKALPWCCWTWGSLLSRETFSVMALGMRVCMAGAWQAWATVFGGLVVMKNTRHAGAGSLASIERTRVHSTHTSHARDTGTQCHAKRN